jgi:hypothetical protein
MNTPGIRATLLARFVQDNRAEPFSRTQYEGRIDAIAREAGCRFARGSLLERMGRLLMPDELEKERRQLCENQRRELEKK